jgi:Flp pilus assembly protein CpaB
LAFGPSGGWGRRTAHGEVLSERHVDATETNGNAMVMTGPGNGVETQTPGVVTRRTIDRRSELPGARAIVGGLLVAVAGVCTFVAWQQASGGADGSYAVAARPIHPGEALTADDIRFQRVELPTGLSAGAVRDAAGIEGRVALGPIAEGELVQLGQLSDPGGSTPAGELSFSIARDRAVDGRLRSGDLVDVFVTDEQGTTAVAERLQIVDLAERGGTSFTTTAELTITVAVPDPALREPLIQALRQGEVTLVRSTHLPAGGDG